MRGFHKLLPLSILLLLSMIKKNCRRDSEDLLEESL
jgi:hypothetical protein